MKMKDRLELVSRIGFEFSKNKSNKTDGYWIIGMLADLTLTKRELQQHIEKVKQEFPEYTHLFSIDN
jgi:ribulose bisphosphate carboxylase small subunit